jgi:hypothetical protein
MKIRLYIMSIVCWSACADEGYAQQAARYVSGEGQSQAHMQSNTRIDGRHQLHPTVQDQLRAQIEQTRLETARRYESHQPIIVDQRHAAVEVM